MSNARYIAATLMALAASAALLACSLPKDGQDPQSEGLTDNEQSSGSGSVPGEPASPEFVYAIEDAVLECTGTESWLSVRAIGPAVGSSPTFRLSPVTRIRQDGSYDSIGGLRTADATATSVELASDAIGDRPYFTEETLATRVEAVLPDWVLESGYAEFQVLLYTSNDQLGRGSFSNSLRLETAAAQC